MRVERCQRLGDRVATATRSCHELSQLAEAVYAAVAPAIPFAFACFAVSDPATGLPSWSSKTRPMGCGDEEFAAVEFGGPDINTLAEIAHRDPPVGALWVETDGQLDRCRRYREFLRPRFGFTDELRVVFRDHGASWGALALYREGDDAPFSRSEAQQLGTTSEVLAESVQRSLFCPDRERGATPSPGPAVLIIDRSGTVTHISPAAESAIEELGGWDQGSLPTSVLAIATVARSGSGHAETRAKGCSGAWLSLRAALLSGPPDGADVVVTFEPTRRTDLSGLALAARGLTAREAEVAALVLQGANTRTIAANLYLSPHTVQDHLKAIFAKLGVKSRREMVAQLVLD